MQFGEHHIAQVGHRVSLHGNKGTIKYIGEVQGARGTWIGVEWDNPKRGKHSGEKDGRHYFTCSVPGSGSFIRPSPAISYGQLFLSALVSKYVEVPHSNQQKETVILGSSNGAIEVEAIGLNKVRGKLARLEHLREISLDGEDVAHADPPGEIRRTCPNVRSLDLSNTLLSSWDTVARITSELSALRELSLNCNRFSRHTDATNLHLAFLSLEELRLNGTMTLWREMMPMVSIMPNLRVLELGSNNMEHLGDVESQDKFPATKLEVLNLDENKLLDWDDVMHSISPFKKLRRLILTANKLQRVPEVQTVQSALPHVRHLGLRDNAISKWRDVDALNGWFPDLKTLNMDGNPVFSRSTDFRQQVIARLPHLEALNGTAVSIKERTDSEIYYLSQISRNSQKSGDELQREFPRWKELCEKHGAPESKGTSRVRDTLSDRLINIYVHLFKPVEPDPRVEFGAFSVQALMARLPPPSSLRVLPTMPIRLLRPRLLKSLKLRSDRSLHGPSLDMWLVMEDDELRKIEPDEESRDLAWLGIQDSSHIIVIAGQSDHN